MSKLKNIFIMFIAFSIINGTLLSLNSNGEFDFIEFLSLLEVAEPSELGGIMIKRPSGESKYIPKRFLENNISAVIPRKFGVFILTRDGKSIMISKRKALKCEEVITRLMSYSYVEEKEEQLCNEEYACNMEGFTLDFIDFVKLLFSRAGTYHITRDECRKAICDLPQDDKETINKIYNMIMTNKGLLDEIVEIDEVVNVGKLDFIMKHMNILFVKTPYQDIFFRIIEKMFHCIM